MNIAIDVDGVIADIVTPLLKIISSETNRIFSYEDITEYNISHALNIDKDYINSKFAQIIEGGGIEPYPDAVESVNYIVEKHLTEIVTSRPGKFHTATLNWLTSRGIKIHRIFLKDENSFHRNDILIEDELDLALKFANNKKAILYRHPWNIKCASDQLIFAKNWKEIVARLTV